MNLKEQTNKILDELSGINSIENSFYVNHIKYNLDEKYLDVNEFEEQLVSEEEFQNLFDGYLWEQKEIPNPLKYGPNTTYRNLSDGNVCRKTPTIFGSFSSRW